MSTLDQLELVEGFMDFPNIVILYIKVAQVYETQRMKSKFPLLLSEITLYSLKCHILPFPPNKTD